MKWRLRLPHLSRVRQTHSTTAIDNAQPKTIARGGEYSSRGDSAWTSCAYYNSSLYGMYR